MIRIRQNSLLLSARLYETDGAQYVYDFEVEVRRDSSRVHNSVPVGLCMRLKAFALCVCAYAVTLARVVLSSIAIFFRNGIAGVS